MQPESPAPESLGRVIRSVIAKQDDRAVLASKEPAGRRAIFVCPISCPHLSLRARSQRLLYQRYANPLANSLVVEIDMLVHRCPGRLLTLFKELDFWKMKVMVAKFYDRGVQAQTLRELWRVHQFKIPIPLLASCKFFLVTLENWHLKISRRKWIIDHYLPSLADANTREITIELVLMLEAKHVGAIARPRKRNRPRDEPAIQILKDLAVEDPFSESGIETSKGPLSAPKLEDNKTPLNVYTDMSNKARPNPIPEKKTSLRGHRGIRLWTPHGQEGSRGALALNSKRKPAALFPAKTSTATKDVRADPEIPSNSSRKEPVSMCSHPASMRSIKKGGDQLQKRDSRKSGSRGETAPEVPAKGEEPESQPINFLNFLESYRQKQKKEKTETPPPADFRDSIFNTRGLKHAPSKPAAPERFTAFNPLHLQTQIPKLRDTVYERLSGRVRPGRMSTQPSQPLKNSSQKMRANSKKPKSGLLPSWGPRNASKERFSSRHASRNEALPQELRWTVRNTTASPVGPLSKPASVHPKKISNRSLNEQGLQVNPAVNYEYFEQGRDDQAGNPTFKSRFMKKGGVNFSARSLRSESQRSPERGSLSRKPRPAPLPGILKAVFGKGCNIQGPSAKKPIPPPSGIEGRLSHRKCALVNGRPLLQKPTDPAPGEPEGSE